MTHLGPSISITGDITSDEDLQIDGHVNGRILARNAAVMLGPASRTEADVRAARVRIEGELRGAVSATQRIELAASASVNGSLSADRVMLADGARFNGQIDMDRRTIAAKLAQYQKATT